MEKSSRVPCILHMDSLRGSHKGLKDLFQRYLWEEWKERHGELAEDMLRKFFNLQFVHLKV
nr:probable ubiquitin-like-specific protease 2A isoform X2 [Ipomoea batatas]GMC83544.1 probable ubiquitin-like-specific protease 2A isoform X2 [Ipomoea batatas]GMC89646.1 probable ubiquitin-like-specific protease 2A isoform X2 [Ipomoea batatas]